MLLNSREAHCCSGVPTARALSVVTSSERVTRPWYMPPSQEMSRKSFSPPRCRAMLITRWSGSWCIGMWWGELRKVEQGMSSSNGLSSMSPPLNLRCNQEEAAAILCRCARSFWRVGHVELFARRSGTELRDFLWHVFRRDFPELVAVHRRLDAGWWFGTGLCFQCIYIYIYIHIYIY